MIKSYLTIEDRKKISEAIAVAEKKVSGEIVPCVVNSSGHYREIFWKSMSMGALITSLVVAILDSVHYLGWTQFRWISFIAIAFGGGLTFWVFSKISNGFSRLLVGKHRLHQTVQRHAKELFLDHELFKTKDRTGVLILVSLFERQVVVLGDTGIHAKVQPSDWDQIVQSVIVSIRENKLVMGLLDAVEGSRKLLEKHGFIETDDSNELPNDVLGDR